jgi:hypothetical protein
MVLHFHISHAFTRVLELGTVLAEQAVSMQEEFLAEDVILGDINIRDVGMRLVKVLKVPKLVDIGLFHYFAIILGEGSSADLNAYKL